MENHEIQKEVKAYLLVFVGLAFLTIVTVAVSYLKLNIIAAVILALTIAAVKASLVACYFMHLISERKLITTVLLLTAVFLAAIVLLPMIQNHDALKGTQKMVSILIFSEK